MPVRATPLTAAKVKSARPGRYGDGDGLYLLVRENQTAFWLFRYTLAGRMREMGLGRARGLNSVSLADARVAAAPLHRLVRNGVDPLDQRAAEAAAARASAQAQKARAITFRTVARLYLDAHEAGWRNATHRQQWQTSLDTYVMAYMGDLPVAEVGTAHVLAVLEPIWRDKPETASRIRGRIEAVLDYAKSRDWRGGENPARWRGHLDNLLPARRKVAAVEHHAALPWREIGSFMTALRADAGVAARALEFVILTAARTGEVFSARWGEIDLGANVWTLSAARMKAGREHRVPLCSAAIAVLGEMAKLRTIDSADAAVFPGRQVNKPLSKTAMAMVLRRLGRRDITVHGFRSTFRDWAADETTYPAEVMEAALAHAIPNKVEAAYRRGDLFEKRRGVMEAWGQFCTCQARTERCDPPAARS